MSPFRYNLIIQYGDFFVNNKNRASLGCAEEVINYKLFCKESLDKTEKPVDE